jgi:hypothetical protein
MQDMKDLMEDMRGKIMNIKQIDRNWEGIMTTKQLITMGIVFNFGAFLILACTSGPKESGDSAIDGPPWVTKGSGAFDVAGSKVFYGVGVASGIRNKALLRQTSDNRARAEIAKILSGPPNLVCVETPARCWLLK